jgi:hypothetical protein
MPIRDLKALTTLSLPSLSTWTRQRSTAWGARLVILCIYPSAANFSWEVYNEQHEMVMCALLPCPVADADWPHPGWKPKFKGFKETKRFFLNWALSIIFESAHLASFTGVDIVDPNGVKRKAVPFKFAISKDLGEASSISSMRSSACDSCLVPRKELACLLEACKTGYPPMRRSMW